MDFKYHQQCHLIQSFAALIHIFAIQWLLMTSDRHLLLLARESRHNLPVPSTNNRAMPGKFYSIGWMKPKIKRFLCYCTRQYKMWGCPRRYFIYFKFIRFWFKASSIDNKKIDKKYIVASVSFFLSYIVIQSTEFSFEKILHKPKTPSQHFW